MKPKILLVEDNELNQDMLSRYLALFDFEVAVAGSGARGIEMARSEAPDLILMDMSLPEIDGWEAARRLKDDDSTRSIPIICLTAHAMSGDREKALRAGCDDYLTKPIDFPRLMKKLDDLLKTRNVEPSPAIEDLVK